MDKITKERLKERSCQVPFSYIIENIDSNRFPYPTFFDFTKEEVMAKLFNGRFDFDYILKQIDDALEFMMKRDCNEIIEDGIYSEKVRVSCDANIYLFNIELLCNRKLLYEGLKKYKELSRHRFKYSTREVENKKYDIRKDIFSLMAKHRFYLYLWYFQLKKSNYYLK